MNKPPDDVEVELVEEDTPPPSTQRHPIIPPAPRMPSEPFRLLTVKQPNNAQLMAKLDEVLVAIGKSWATSTEVLHVQRKMARQTDGQGQIINARFDIFHRELALLRGGKDDAEGEGRAEDKSERTPLSARAAVLALGSGKYTVGGTVGILLLKVIATQVPWLDDILQAVGL